MRLLTRPDLDGLTSAVLLSVVEPIDEVVWVEPHPLQSGEVEVRNTDILANLPYHPNCGMWFDHHMSNALPPGTPFTGAFAIDPSAARTIFNHYQDPRLDAYQALLEATDRVDAAQLTLEDVLNPQGYVLISLSLDSKSNFDHSEDYFHQLLTWLKTLPPDEILEKPEVHARCSQIQVDQERFANMIREHSVQEGPVVRTDLRAVPPPLPVGSRFLVYALFPEANASIKVYASHKRPGEVGISLGHSIFNRTCKVNVGTLCARYGGGGHQGAASCQVKPEQVARIIGEVSTILKANQPLDTP